MANGDGAAARLRRKVNTVGGSDCVWCGHWYPASLLRIDHRVALCNGGTDTDVNVQPLCLGCHHMKTVEEARNRAGGATRVPK